MGKDFSITAGGDGFELNDADAFATVASRILGERKYDEMRRQTSSLPKGRANDMMVDEAMRLLNRPLVKLAMGLSR